MSASAEHRSFDSRDLSLAGRKKRGRFLPALLAFLSLGGCVTPRETQSEDTVPYTPPFTVPATENTGDKNVIDELSPHPVYET